MSFRCVLKREGEAKRVVEILSRRDCRRDSSSLIQLQTDTGLHPGVQRAACHAMSQRLSKQLWLAPIHSSARGELIELCQERFRAGKEDSIVYLTAEVGLLQLVRERLVDGARVKGCHELRVFMFHELVAALLSGTDFSLCASASEPHRLKSVPPAHGLKSVPPAHRLKSVPPAHGLQSVSPAQTQVCATAGEAAKVLLVAEAIDDLASSGRLHYFSAIAGRQGLARSVARTIGEIKRAGKRAKDFSEFTLLALGSERDRDLAAIFERYHELLSARGIFDQDDLYLIARDWLDENGLRNGPLGSARLMIVDGFYDFTPVQLQILERLIRLIPEVIVHFVWDERNAAVFEPIVSTIHQVEAIAQFERRTFSPSTASSEATARLATGFLNHSSLKPKLGSSAGQRSDKQAVSFFAALDRRVEVREVARRIKKLLVRGPIAPSEIACVIRDGDRYLDEFAKTLGRLGIPYDLTRSFALPAFNSVRALIFLLEFLREPNRMELLARAMTCGYFGSGDASQLDRFKADVERIGGSLAVRQWRHRAHWLIRSLRATISERAKESDDGDLDRLNRTAVQRQIESVEKTLSEVDSFCELSGVLPVQAASRAMFAALRTLLGGLQFHERLQDRLRSEQQHAERFARAASDHEAAKRAIELLASASHAMDGPIARELTCRRFCDLMLEAIELGEFSHRLGAEGGVRVLEVTRARGLQFRAVFIVGLVEGEFPKPAEPDWIYSAGEREELARQGLVLEDRSPRTMKKEELLFYHSAVQAAEQLCLSYPRATEEETASVPSYFFKEAAKVFPDSVEEYAGAVSQPSERNPFARVSSLAELKAEVLRSLWSAAAPRPRLALALYSRLHQARAWSPSLFRRIAAEQVRAGREFSSFDGALADSELLRQLGVRFGREHVFSATQLNLYGQCPFRFFIERILEMKSPERAELDLEAMDRGRLLHEILYRFFREHLGERLLESQRDACRRQLESIAMESFREFARSKPPLSEKLWEIQRQSMLGDLLALLDFEIENQSEHGELRPHWLELPFGMKDEHRPMSQEPAVPNVRLSRDGDVVEIRGRIDRVDRSDDGKFVAYDYKSRSTPEIQSIEDGLDFQIPIYVMALQQHFLRAGEEVIGGGYYSIAKQSRDNGMFRGAYSDSLRIRKKRSLLDEERWSELLRRSAESIWEYVEAMRGGDFRVAPRDCPTPCDYRAVCRFERHRIARKLEPRQE